VQGQDHVDEIRGLWATERPDLDTSPVEVVARVGRAAAYFDRGIESVLEGYGLNRPAFDVLATLRRIGPPYRLSPTQLYRHVMRTSGVMTRRVDLLEAGGLVRRVPDPNDRRGVLVELTGAGRQLVDAAVGPHLDNEERMLGALNREDRAALAGLLRKLLLSFEARAPDQPLLPERGRRSQRRC
jgi:DNA-binding MarR family transcriptional regulator